MTKPIPLPEESKYIDTSKWQDSSDPIERMAYWINWLSPHNLWKSKSALQEMLSQAQQEAVSAERERIKGIIECMGGFPRKGNLRKALLANIEREWFGDMAKYNPEALQKEDKSLSHQPKQGETKTTNEEEL